MIVSGSVSLAAAPQALHAALSDAEQLCRALPNVDAFGWTDGPQPGSFAVTIRPAIALGELPFRTVWTRVADGTAAPDALRYRVEGRGDEHRFALDAALTLAGLPDAGGTRAAWDVDCHFTGMLRSAGQRVLVPVVDRQIRLVLEAAARIA